MHELFNRIKREVNEDRIKQEHIGKKVQEFSTVQLEHHQKINLNELKMKEYEKVIKKVSIEGSTKEDVSKRFYALRTRIMGFESQIFQLKQNLYSTDTYLDRYLPCQQLNLLYNVLEDAFGDHIDRKSFYEKLVDKFKECEQKIKKEEKEEQKSLKESYVPTTNLNKKAYHIPEIKVPSTIQFED